MTVSEYKKLIEKYGAERTAAFIEKLNLYKAASGKTYKSDYAAILQWVVESVNGKLQSQPNKPADKILRIPEGENNATRTAT